MPYIGNPPANRFVTPPEVQRFNGDNSTTEFTLANTIGADQDILVSVDGVIQDTTSYSVNDKTLTFTTAPSSGTNNIFVFTISPLVASINHPATSPLNATSGTFSGDIDVDGTTNLDDVDIDGAVDMASTLTVGGVTTLNGKFLIDGSNNDLMTFRTTGDTASQVLGLQFQNNSEAVTAQIFGTGENSTSGVFRIKGIGSVELHGGDVGVTGDATNMYKLDATGHHFFNTTTNHNASELNVDFDSGSECGMGINDTASGNGAPFIAFLTGGTFRGSITNNNNTAVAYNTTSDYRLKENVSYTFDATTELKKLKPCKFNFIGSDLTVEGFLAHEAQEIVPQAVIGTKDETRTSKNVVLDKNENIIANNITEDEWKTGKDAEIYDDNTSWKSTITQKHYQQIDYSKLVPLLVKTIQELEARITALENA
jgi:hypothetical protein